MVNNNAAATWLVLNAVAAGKEVIVSRGQLVEIGGSFRLPDVMAASGARLVEVGTTNKTHARDYQRAITANTAAILRVHPSNYKITGFTSEVPLEELVADRPCPRTGADRRRRRRGAGGPVAAGAGRGADAGAARSAAGADLVTSSTDKLIGASQGGIILGKAALVEAVRKNPLARIVRVGQTRRWRRWRRRSCCSSTRHGRCAEVPTLRMVCRGLARDRRAGRADRRGDRAACARRRWRSSTAARRWAAARCRARTCPRGWWRSPAGPGPRRAGRPAAPPRPPVFTRISKDQVLVDPRTLLDGDEQPLIDAVVAKRGGCSGRAHDQPLGSCLEFGGQSHAVQPGERVSHGG